MQGISTALPSATDSEFSLFNPPSSPNASSRLCNLSVNAASEDPPPHKYKQNTMQKLEQDENTDLQNGMVVYYSNLLKRITTLQEYDEVLSAFGRPITTRRTLSFE